MVPKIEAVENKNLKLFFKNIISIFFLALKTNFSIDHARPCLLYTSDAADE